MHSGIHSRWRDLAETSGEASAHDSQSLDSGAEGPEEPDRPEHHSSPSGKLGVPTTHFTCCRNQYCIPQRKDHTVQNGPGCCVYFWTDVDRLLPFSEQTVMDARRHYCISLSSTKGKLLLENKTSHFHFVFLGVIYSTYISHWKIHYLKHTIKNT